MLSYRSIRLSPPRLGTLAVATALFLSSAVLPAQPLPPSDLDIHGEKTGCAAPSLCGDTGDSVASAGDVNGDGTLDLLIAAPTVTGPNPSTGRVYLFHGPFDGELDIEQAVATITGLEFGDLVGTVRSGDVDGDGLSDVVVGSRGPDVDGGILNGQVWIFYAPVVGELSIADADATITGTSFSELGRAVDVGDFDGDGTDDVLAGASQSGSGRAHLFYGPIVGELDGDDADAIVTGTLGFEELGEAVAAVDLNGDEVDDLAIGAPNFPLGDLTAGTVFVFFGPLSGNLSSLDADVTIFGEQINDEFGSHLAAGGDVNGDGAADLLVGAWQLFRDEPGRAYLFHGPLSPGVLDAARADAILLGEPEDGNDLFGILDGAGDVNGDGFDDVVVGAQSGGPISLGRAYVFHGPLGGEIAAADADWIFDAPRIDPFFGLDFLGRAVAAAGDLDGNGFDDLLLGAPGTDGPGFARVVQSPGLRLRATLLSEPILPSEGGEIVFEVAIANTSSGSRATEAWLEVRADRGASSLRRGPVELSFGPTEVQTNELQLAVPADLPAGDYTATVHTGTFPAPSSSDEFSFSKSPGD